MIKIQDMAHSAALGLTAALLSLPAPSDAQTVPGQSVGLTTGFRYNDNRGLDSPSQGSTTELFTRLDFGLVFATPLQSLSLDGDITLRGLDGAEAGGIPDGFSDPNLRLRYNRAVRNAQLTVTAFGQETETSTLVPELNSIDLSTVTEDATRLSYGYDAELELRREAPFGVTLSTSYRGLRYSDTTSTTLQDTDRYSIGADFRFDIDSLWRATLGTEYRTFRADGSTAGTRETYVVDAGLTRALPNGSVGVDANITSVPEGERYQLALSHTVRRPLWDIGSSLGVTQSAGGSNFTTGSLNVGYELPNGALGLNVSHSLRSGLNDNEQEFSSIRFNYDQQLNEVSTFNVSMSYQETNPTGTGSNSSLGSIGLSYQRTFTDDWRMDVGLTHRVSKSSTSSTAEDNSLSVSFRRELTARR